MNQHKTNNLPSQCPSCAALLTVERLVCSSCSTTVQGSFSLPVIARLSTDEQLLAVNFIKTGGSLKDLAKLYNISYPTIRNRIDDLSDRLIELERTITTQQAEGGDNE